MEKFSKAKRLKKHYKISWNAYYQFIIFKNINILNSEQTDYSYVFIWFSPFLKNN